MKQDFGKIFPTSPIIGMIHLKALPGAPAYAGGLQPVIDAALEDMQALETGGVDGMMVENFFDAPFFKDYVGPETVAAMARILTMIRERTSLPLGVNVLRNAASSAMALATVCDCQFIRTNQLSWAMLTDQGVIEGKAAELLRYRRMLESDVLVFGDCLSKHASPLVPQSMELVALDTWERGGADALIISGTATGHATDLKDVAAAKKGAPEAPVLIGSGVAPENVAELLQLADGVLVGSYFKRDGNVAAPVDVQRVQRLVEAVKEAAD